MSPPGFSRTGGLRTAFFSVGGHARVPLACIVLSGIHGSAAVMPVSFTVGTGKESPATFSPAILSPAVHVSDGWDGVRFRTSGAGWPQA